MKITISSPDGLGDFVLRIPFFEALREAGHDLQIFMRPPAFELARALLPTARVEAISEDPYARLVRFRRNPFGRQSEGRSPHSGQTFSSSRSFNRAFSTRSACQSFLGV